MFTVTLIWRKAFTITFPIISSDMQIRDARLSKKKGDNTSIIRCILSFTFLAKILGRKHISLTNIICYQILMCFGLVSWNFKCSLSVMFHKQITPYCSITRKNTHISVFRKHKTQNWSGIRVAGWSLQNGNHSKPTTLKLQHTSNQEQYDQFGNSTE